MVKFMVAAGALALAQLGATAAFAQDKPATAAKAPAQAAPTIDPAKAAAQIAGMMQPLPKDMGEGVRLTEAHAEGPVLIVLIEVPAAMGDNTGVLAEGFTQGMCGDEGTRAAMGHLFAAGMRVRPDISVGGKRVVGKEITACTVPAAPPAMSALPSK